MTTRRTIGVRRVYDEPQETDGCRVLVDRLWPRGLRKADAALDEWCRDVAPSTELRRWYGHAPERLAEFRSRYLAELDNDEHAEALAHLRVLAAQPLVLLTATRELDLSHAAVLATVLSAIPGRKEHSRNAVAGREAASHLRRGAAP